MDRTDYLIAAVNSAFPSIPSPPDDALVFTQYWDGNQWVPIPYPNAEPYEVGQFLRNRPWQDLATDLKSWRNRSVCLSCLTAEGLAYYLPAYLVFVLRETQDPYWGDILETTLFNLTPIEPSRAPTGQLQIFQLRSATFNKFVRLLSNDQRLVIRDFLNYASERYTDIYVFEDDLRALAEYWENL